jgi:hypothetical protein
MDSRWPPRLVQEGIKSLLHPYLRRVIDPVLLPLRDCLPCVYDVFGQVDDLVVACLPAFV